jgi:ankyrin repeat protein
MLTAINIDHDLLEACKKRNFEMVKKLTERKFFSPTFGLMANVNYQERGDNYRSPLIVAANNGDIPIVEILLERGAMVDIMKSGKETPLYLASEKGHTEVVRMLLEKGANVNIESSHHGTPLYPASENGHAEVVKLLLSKDKELNNRKLNYSAPYGGNLPLHLASENGRLDVVKVLLENGAKVNIKNWKEETPLYLASKNGHQAVVDILIFNGADINDALYMASKNGNEEVVKLLLSKGARFDKKTIDVANSNGYDKIVEILEKWPLTMTLATLQSDPMVYNVYNHTDVGDMINLKDYMGKKGIDYGGKRRNKKSNKKIKKSRKSKKQKSIKRRK